MDRNDSTCWSVVLGAAAGETWDREAFSRIYGPVIRRYLAARWRAPVDDPEIEDATQEVFVQIFKPHGALGNLEPTRPGGFRAYLFGIVRNVALMVERSDRRRQRRVGTESAFEAEPPVADETTMSQVFDREWLEAITREAKELMTRRWKTRCSGQDHARLLERRYADGIAPRDIATEMGCSVETVYEALRRAKEEYRTALLDVLGAHHPNESRAQLEQRCADLSQQLGG